MPIFTAPMSTSAAVATALVLVLAGCGPYPPCRPGRDTCAARFESPESCGSMRRVPERWTRPSWRLTVWRDPHDGCWVGVSGDPPAGFTAGHDAWCNQGLLDDPGLCED